MQKNYRVDAEHLESATDSQGRRVLFHISDGCNGFYRIITNHDEIYVSKEQLIQAMELLEQEKTNC